MSVGALTVVALSRELTVFLARNCYALRIHVFDHPRRGVVYNLNGVCMFVCMSVCQTITFENLGVGSLFLHTRYVLREYGSSSDHMKVIGSRSRSQKVSQKGRKLQFPQCKTSIGNNSGFITALHGMQTRSYDENSVRPSVCLSVCPSVRPSVRRVNCDKTAERYV